MRIMPFLREEFKGILYLSKYFIVTGVVLWQYFPAMSILTAISIIREKNANILQFLRTVDFVDGVASQSHFKNFP